MIEFFFSAVSGIVSSKLQTIIWLNYKTQNELHRFFLLCWSNFVWRKPQTIIFIQLLVVWYQVSITNSLTIWLKYKKQDELYRFFRFACGVLFGKIRKLFLRNNGNAKQLSADLCPNFFPQLSFIGIKLEWERLLEGIPNYI